MSDQVIHVDEAALSSLKNAVETAGKDYKEKLARLSNLIDEITAGDIEGDPAQQLRDKFIQKEQTFRNITATLEDAEEYMGIQSNKFDTLISDLKSGMR